MIEPNYCPFCGGTRIVLGSLGISICCPRCETYCEIEHAMPMPPEWVPLVRSAAAAGQPTFDISPPKEWQI